MDNIKKINGTENKKKQYFIIKNKDSNDLLKIKESFKDPNKYFTKDKNIIIGNLSYNSKKKLKNKLIIKPFSLSESTNNINNNQSKKSKNKMYKSKSYTQGEIVIQSRKKSKIICLIFPEQILQHFQSKII